MASSKTIPGSSIAAKFSDFNILDFNYKHIGKTPVPASLFTPVNIKPGKHPVIIRWHGGGLLTGERLFADWFGLWMLQFASQTNSIMVLPDYRLMPEAKGIDILQDAKDFYAWLLKPGNLAALLPEGVEADLDHLLVSGESAGGWFAVQSGFIVPHAISAIISEYPMIELRAPHYSQPYEKQIFNPPMPQLDPAILDKFVAGLDKDAIATSRALPAGVDFVAITLQQGTWTRYFGSELELFPLEVLEGKSEFPPTWFLHGQKDSVVPVASTEKFAAALKAKFGESKVHVWLQPDGDHGFDNHDAVTGEPATMETDWVKTGTKWIRQFWPA